MLPRNSVTRSDPDLGPSCTVDRYLLDHHLAVHFAVHHDLSVHWGIDLLQLPDVLVEDLLDLQGTLLRVPLLVVLVVDVGDAKPGLVSLGPFKVTVTRLS